MLLSLKGFGAGFDRRVVVAEVDLELPRNGLTAFMGPTGVGKSTLLRTICGLAQRSASLMLWGEAYYRGAPLGVHGWPGLVTQDARLLVSTVRENLVTGLTNRGELSPQQQQRDIATHLKAFGCSYLLNWLHRPVVELELVEQRIVAILRQLLSDPDLLCVDEPTTDLAEEDAARILRLLRLRAADHGVLMASHHQGQVKAFADYVVLLAGGRIQEARAPREFFSAPASSSARQFVASGSCATPSPDAWPEELAEDAAPPPPLPGAARRAIQASAGPRDFVWVEPGRLAGTPRPGVVQGLATDLDALARVGVSRLLTLLEEPLDCRDELHQRGMKAVHFAVADMAAPSHQQASAFCRLIDRWLQRGEVVAVHCKAGHGRTGTALAAYRIWRGESAAEAVDGIRRLERRWIQSQEQLDFLESFVKHLRSPKA